jgi:hypothetical protein
MRLASVLAVTVLVLAAHGARADLTGSWRVGFSNAPGDPIMDYCRYDLVESAGGEVQGYLGVCILGTDGLLSGTVDGTGALTLRVVAPDDIGCEVYGIDGTVAPDVSTFDGNWTCDFPIQISGYLTATRCNPATPGDCPEVAGASLQPRPHEVRACAPTPATPCEGSVGARASLKIARSDTYHYALTFKLPDATGVTVADLGDPTTVRDYVACVYHTVGGSPVVAAMEPAWAATFCDDEPCWEVQPTGLKYKNKSTERGKITQLKVKVRGTGASTSVVKGGITTVLPPPVGNALELPIIVQLLAGDDVCFGATFTTATMNAAGLLKAKNGQ